MCFLSIDWCLTCLGFHGFITAFGRPPVHRLLRALCSVHGCIQHRSISFLVAFDRNGLRLASCEIWRWIIHRSFEKKATLYKNSECQTVGLSKVYKFPNPPLPTRSWCFLPTKRHLAGIYPQWVPLTFTRFNASARARPCHTIHTHTHPPTQTHRHVK
jgi:hypothetical protein